ncbi:25890_t:CDS:1, partial [Racocetra persica]
KEKDKRDLPASGNRANNCSTIESFELEVLFGVSVFINELNKLPLLNILREEAS